MAQLTIVVDVACDPTTEDPHEIADAILDYGEHGALALMEPPTSFVSAEWTAGDAGG